MSAAPQLAEELFNEHHRRIYLYCLRQLGSPEEAEDAVQATYLNACRSLKDGFEPEAAQAWLFKVAHNVCLTRQRSSYRRARVERPHDLQAVQDTIAAPEASGDELFGLDEALAGLPDQQRNAILLREWQGLSYREVATKLGVTQAAVETLIFRARRSLADSLERPSERRLDGGPHDVERNHGPGVEAAPELVREGRSEDAGGRGDELAELDERGAEVLEELAHRPGERVLRDRPADEAPRCERAEPAHEHTSGAERAPAHVAARGLRQHDRLGRRERGRR